jgi:hypothetical protein
MLLQVTLAVASFIVGWEFAKWFRRRYGRDLFHPHPDDLRAQIKRELEATKSESPS